MTQIDYMPLALFYRYLQIDYVPLALFYRYLQIDYMPLALFYRYLQTDYMPFVLFYFAKLLKAALMDNMVVENVKEKFPCHNGLEGGE
jgi:hypothetical protein